MSLSPLRIIPAGAGSGKTYTIQTNLAQWIQDNQVNAERVVAVTFTEAAATELRERIRDELIRTGRHTDALKLDQALSAPFTVSVCACSPSLPSMRG